MAYSSFSATDGIVLIIKVKDKRMPSFSTSLVVLCLKPVVVSGDLEGTLACP